MICKNQKADVRLLYAIVVAFFVSSIRLYYDSKVLITVPDAQSGLSLLYVLAIAIIVFLVVWGVFYCVLHMRSILRILFLTVFLGICLYQAIEVQKIIMIDAILRQAESLEIKPERLAEIEGHDTLYFGTQLDNRLASNPNSTPELLIKLYAKNQSGTNLSLARNPNTPAFILKKLSDSEDKLIREALSKNPSYKRSVMESK